MFDDAGFITPIGAFVFAVVRMIVWIAMLYVPLRLAGVNIREALRVLTHPEAVLFGLYSIGAAVAVGGLFPN